VRDLPSTGASAGRCRSHRHEREPCAFGAHLIGIDPDFPIHVSDRLLESHHGLFLQLGLKGIAGTMIDRPNRIEDRPDRYRLAIRFEQFKKAA
jgi:putative restriction endonuclease